LVRSGLRRACWDLCTSDTKGGHHGQEGAVRSRRGQARQGGRGGEVHRERAAAGSRRAADDGLAWFGIRLGASSFGIFDAFPDESAREAHLHGKVAEALMAKASELFTRPPSIEKVDVLAEKLPS
jgi:hypothetical protein